MRTAKALLPLALILALTGSATAQMSTGRTTEAAAVDLVQIEEELDALRGALASMTADLAALEAALGKPDNFIWLAKDGSGWRAMPRAELIQKIQYRQLAAERAERRNQTSVAGLGLPGSLVSLVESRPNRPAGRVLREWTESNADQTEKAIADYRQDVQRNIRNVQSWIADNEKLRQEAMKPVSESVLSQAGCHIPAGRWSVDANQEVLEVRVVGATSIATKTKGSANIPAGKVSFYVNGSTCFGGMQMADAGFENPYWQRGQVKMDRLSNDQIRIVWPEQGAVTYSRVQ